MKLLCVLAALAMCPTASPAAEPISLEVRQIESFAAFGPDADASPLRFIGGLQLLSDDDDFGGLSGIDMLDSDTVFLIGDTGTFVRARLVREGGGRVAGLADAEMGSLFPGGDGSKRQGDAEDIAFDPADRTRGILVRERQANAMLAFEMVDGSPQPGRA